MKIFEHNPRRVVWFLATIVFFWTLASYAQTNRRTAGKNAQKKEVYTRPKPTKPIKPEMPSQDRYVTNKVFLEYADSLYHNEHLSEAQVVVGNVKFRQGNMFLTCDSAYYYAENNSLDAFGHIKMSRGDTLFVYADKVFYDGQQRLARLRKGPTQPKVKVVNRKVTLTSDSLFYSMAMDRGWYDNGGKLEDDMNVLTSVYGEYSPATKRAEFFHNVVLLGKKDDNQLYTDTLYYNTQSHVAEIVSPTRIYGKNDTIITSSGRYNTSSGDALLYARSLITHRDSNNNVTTLEGDSIVYDKESKISRAFMFHNPAKNPTPMVINDTARKVRLIGTYGEYNDITREAYATGNPLLIEYSRKDTNFLRADEIISQVINRKVEVPYTEEMQALYDSLMILQKQLDTEAEKDSLIERRDLIAEHPELKRDSVEKEYVSAYALGRGRYFNNQMQGIADTLEYHQFDSLLFMKRKPIIWSDEQQIKGDTIIVHFNDSTADRARVVKGFAVELVDEDFYNQLKGKEMRAFFKDETLDYLEVDENVEVIMLPQENDSTYNKLITAQCEHLYIEMDSNDLQKLKMWPAVDGTVYPLFQIKESNKYLDGFSWDAALRPRREWYNGRWVWDDDLGDVSDELEEYFRKE